MAYVYWLHLPEHSDPKSEGYIGITGGTVEDRFAEHVRKAKGKGNLHVHNAIRKYGDQIKVSVLHEDSIEFCELLEWAYRPHRQIAWNIMPGGSPSSIGVEKAEGAKLNMRDKARRGERHHYYGKKLSKDHVQRMIESRRGQVRSVEHCKSLSSALTGREFSETHKAAISKAAKAKHPWQNPTCNKQIWVKADEIFNKYSEGLRDSALAKAFSVNHNKIAALSRKFKSGWIPQEDPAWLQFKEQYLTEQMHE
jgi:hypothetical protein